MDVDDEIPNIGSSSKSSVGGFIEKLNLPHLVAGAAGTAFSKLVAGTVDIPLAWLEGKSQAIRDDTNSKTKLRMSLVEKAADGLENDESLVARARERFLGDLSRKQENREAVAKISLEQLSEDSERTFTENVSDDWLDYFSAYAEKANSEKMRDLWARILTGEVRTPGKFSLSTMRFMAELDASTAKCIEKYFTKVFDQHSIFHQKSFSSSPALSEVTLLENIGLLNGVGETRNRTLKVQENGFLFLQFQKNALVIAAKPSLEIKLNCLLLTQMGREVLSILSLADDVEEGNTIAVGISKVDVDRISWFATRKSEGRVEAIYPETVVWEKPIVEVPSSETTN
jgi:Protein of unknown function (DUF2806)